MRRLFTKDLGVEDSIGILNVGEGESQAKKISRWMAQDVQRRRGTKQLKAHRDLSTDTYLHSLKAHSDSGDNGKN